MICMNYVSLKSIGLHYKVKIKGYFFLPSVFSHTKGSQILLSILI